MGTGTQATLPATRQTGGGSARVAGVPSEKRCTLSRLAPWAVISCPPDMQQRTRLVKDGRLAKRRYAARLFRPCGAIVCMPGSPGIRPGLLSYALRAYEMVAQQWRNGTIAEKWTHPASPDGEGASLPRSTGFGKTEAALTAGRRPTQRAGHRRHTVRRQLPALHQAREAVRKLSARASRPPICCPGS